MEFITYGPDALPSLMNHVLDAIGNRRKIALIGEMGAGKTTFAAAFCHHLGVKQMPSSPTYSLVNEYEYLDRAGKPAKVHHLDLYRLRSTEEALDIGLEDLLLDDSFCLIEWPQLVEGLLPEDTARVSIEVTGPTTRHIFIK